MPDNALKVGITGHRRLGDDDRVAWRVFAQSVCILDQLRGLARLEGRELRAFSSLAIGADSLFAQAALGLGIDLVAILPFETYREDFSPEESGVYEKLLNLCRETRCLPRKKRSNQAYLDAGKAIVDEVDYLVAVWNGLPAAGKGGTGDVVAYARRKNVKVLRIEI